MKNILYLFIALVAFASCNDDDVKDALAPNVDGETTSLSYTDVINGIFEEGVQSSEAGFTLKGDLTGFSGYELYVQKDSDGTTLGMLSSETSLPVDYLFTLSDILSATNTSISDWEVGSNANFLVKLKTDTGKSYFSEDTFTIPVSCPSTIGGTFDYVSTNLVGNVCDGSQTTSGTVTWSSLGAGNYSTTDLGFGQFGTCWGDSPANSASAKINETCGKLSVLGTDQYGDSYTYTIVEIDGANLTMNWSNTYGDGGTVVLTRTDGTNWPENLKS